MGQSFQLYNTLSRSIEDFEPLQAGSVGIYVCGMTVYDHIHVGHARAMVVFDTFVRYLRHRDWQVNFVRNFTDVDDKIIKRAAERDEPPMALAERYIAAFHEDVGALGLAAPDSEPRVSTSIDDIIALITKLIERGHAYVQDGTAWYDVSSFSDYGKLSGQKVEELRNPDDAPGKRSAQDFALWKAGKPGEPTWDSPWGPGRPGWHIECSAMSCACLGERFDIHGGGLDLVFPHHENEIAQSEGAHGPGYATYWMHNGLLTMSSGQKMGKSLGNVINVREALKRYPAEALRLYYLQNHYRSPLPWNDEVLPEALGMLARLYDARDNAEAMGGQEPVALLAEQLGADASAVLALTDGFADKFQAALARDFNTAKALGYVFELARAVNRFAGHKKAKKRGAPIVAGALDAFTLVTEALGLLGLSTEAFHEEVKAKRLEALGLSVADIEAQIAARQQARADKDWARADAIREALDAQQIVVMDRTDGVDWRVRLS